MKIRFFGAVRARRGAARALFTAFAALSLLLGLHVPAGAQVPPGEPAWYDTLWAFRRAVLVDNTAGASDLTSFQVKITLSSATFDFSRPLASGADLRVTDADGTTLLPYYVERYDATQRVGTIWVRVPRIPAQATRMLYLYYGNAAPAAFKLPPTGLFKRPTAPMGNGLIENIVYDAATARFYAISAATTRGPIRLFQAAHPLGPWTDLGTILDYAPAGAWDASEVYAPYLVQSNGVWYLFYSGGPDAGGDDHNIGVATATSVTGPFTRYAGNPIIVNGARANAATPGTTTWEQFRACEPSVHFSGILNKWVLLYMGDAGSGANQEERVGYATADNLLGPWTKYANNPVIDFSPAPAWDAGTVADPFAVEMNGVAYVFYTGGPTSQQPWMTGFSTTTNYTSFAKGHVVYGRGATGEWDAANAFRGDITQLSSAFPIGTTWYFPYTNISAWGVATMDMTSTARGWDPFQVLDYYDDFSGTTLDPNKWAQPVLPGEGGTRTVANGILTLGSGLGTFHTLVGRREFGAGHLLETVARHPNADGTGLHAGEVGLGQEDRSNTLRLYDYNSPFFLRGTNATIGEFDVIPIVVPGQTDLPLAQVIDTQWHTHRVAFVGPGRARFQNDAQPWEDMTLGVPVISLKPWLFSYAAPGVTTNLEVDSVLVRRYADTEPALSVGAETAYAATPAAPTNLTATVVSASQINLAWTDNATNETGYKIERAPGVNGTAFVEIALVGANVASYQNTGLTAGTGYTYRVRATSGAGDSAYSNSASATTQTVSTAPPAPTGLAATAGDARVTLTWNASAGATDYKVKRATVSGGPYTVVASGITATTYADTSVTNGTTYYYVVSATNAVGESANSAQVSATPRAASLAAPTGLSANRSNRNKVRLSWTQSASAGVTRNRVYRATVSGGPYTTLVTLSATNAYTDTNAPRGTRYYYVVTALNAVDQESPKSNQASVAP